MISKRRIRLTLTCLLAPALIAGSGYLYLQSPNVRTRTLLGEMRPDKGRWHEWFVKLHLARGDRTWEYDVRTEIISIGPAAVPELVRSLDDPQVCSFAVDALVDLGDERAVEGLKGVLTEYLQSPQPAGLFGGATGGSISDQPAIDESGATTAPQPQAAPPPPPAATTHPSRAIDEHTAELALVALGRIGTPAAVETLIHVMKSERGAMHHWAMEMLGLFRHKAAAGPLIEHLEEQEPRCGGCNVALALGLLGDEQALEPLAELAQDEHIFRAEPGVRGLSYLGDPRAVDVLLAHAWNGYTLAQIGDARVIRPLLAKLRTGDDKERLACMYGLAMIDSPEPAEALVEAATNGTDHTMAAAMLASAFRHDPQASELVAARLSDKSAQMHRAAADALLILNSPRMRNWRQLLRHDDWRVRARAAFILGQVGDEAAIPDLFAALEDPAEMVRRQAALALAKRAKIAGDNDYRDAIHREIVLKLFGPRKQASADMVQWALKQVAQPRIDAEGPLPLE